MRNLALGDQDWVIKKTHDGKCLIICLNDFDKSVIFTCIILNRYLLINPHLNSDCLGQTKKRNKKWNRNRIQTMPSGWSWLSRFISAELA